MALVPDQVDRNLPPLPLRQELVIGAVLIVAIVLFILAGRL
jgi:hypothetical protein